MGENKGMYIQSLLEVVQENMKAEQAQPGFYNGCKEDEYNFETAMDRIEKALKDNRPSLRPDEFCNLMVAKRLLESLMVDYGLI